MVSDKKCYIFNIFRLPWLGVSVLRTYTTPSQSKPKSHKKFKAKANTDQANTTQESHGQDHHNDQDNEGTHARKPATILTTILFSIISFEDLCKY
jgi:hypothetical protein